MACAKNGQRCADASRLNGISGQVSRYLNVVGSLGTYRDLNSLEEVPQRLAEITAAYFGVKGLIEGYPRLSGILGIIVGLHLLEQVTGGIATMGIRMYGRGRPIAQYRGIVLRKSPFTPKMAKLFNRLTGGRVLDSNGYYFFSNGRTWHCQSGTIQIGDMPRTLTTIRTYSIPHREFYFDRPIYVQGIDPDPVDSDRVISMQRVVDMILGDENPDTVPGFLGSINEFEDASGGIGYAKRAFFLANWLLIDPGERDGGAIHYVDYEAFAKGTAPGGAAIAKDDGYYKIPKSSSASSAQPVLKPVAPAYSSTSYYPAATAAVPLTAAQTHYGANYFSSKTVPSQPVANVPIPLSNVKGRYQVRDKVYPLIVKRIVPVSSNPDLQRADAIYYDYEEKVWREVVDDEDRETIARRVSEGTLSVTHDKSLWPPDQVYY